MAMVRLRTKFSNLWEFANAFPPWGENERERESKADSGPIANVDTVYKYKF